MVIYCRWCAPRDEGDGHGTTTEQVGKLDTYQGLLSSQITISTLLLGFILTGTMLSINFTGNEHYGSAQIRDFVLYSGLAALLAGISLVTSFATSVQGAQFYSTHNAQTAVMHMRRSLITVVGSEMALYFSLVVFLGTVADFSYLAYAGPDICPRTWTGPHLELELRPDSFCAQVGLDLFEAVKATNKSCRALFPNADLDDVESICLYYDQVAADEKPFAFFMWNNADPREWPLKEGHVASASRLSMTRTAAKLFCKSDIMEDAMNEVCRQPTNPSCAHFTMAFRQADDCEDIKVDEAERCYRVCHWRDGATVSLQKMIYYGMAPIIALIIYIVAVRTLTTLEVLQAKHHHHGDDSSGDDVRSLVLNPDD
eukprot:TRINITY_DN36333_c0_g1_i1.p1 TRINITY_DN36333_c0_g1~~TRINITY_DN36333_c0_g1_i1.p1  ORF type:complete len:370 (-),score=41.62 TRINITY_DN36333_c0_g1_i1:271-1380(-)